MGADADVPLSNPQPSPGRALQIYSPGAAISTNAGLQLEKWDHPLCSLILPTVITRLFLQQAGNFLYSSRFRPLIYWLWKLPDATTKYISDCSIASFILSPPSWNTQEILQISAPISSAYLIAETRLSASNSSPPQIGTIINFTFVFPKIPIVPTPLWAATRIPAQCVPCAASSPSSYTAGESE